MTERQQERTCTVRVPLTGWMTRHLKPCGARIVEVCAHTDCDYINPSPYCEIKLVCESGHEQELV